MDAGDILLASTTLARTLGVLGGREAGEGSDSEDGGESHFELFVFGTVIYDRVYGSEWDW